jgi:transcriptional regulator
VYVPTIYQQTDLAALHDFIEQHSFALLCSTAEDGTPFASHLPFLLERHAGPHGTLVGHLARANPQWRHAEGRPVQAVFSGPHHYISPAWYQAEDVVPTWNYVAVHASGRFQPIHDRDVLWQIVQDLVAVHEGARRKPWTLNERTSYLDNLLKGIVGFRIAIDRLEGKWKLGQNHPPERRRRAATALRQEGGEDARAIAELMERTIGEPPL